MALAILTSVTLFLTLAGLAAARDIFIQVGANTTTDATTIFQPNNVTAMLGDTVWFNFTSGNHTATQADFAAPCIFIHDHSPAENGFDAGFHVQSSGTSSTYPVPITEINQNETYWFFDFNTCGLGGVGVINQNASTGQTIEGFILNAQRLNGTATTTTSGSSATTPGSTASRSPSTSTTPSSAATYFARVGVVAAAPLIVASLFI